MSVVMKEMKNRVLEQTEAFLEVEVVLVEDLEVWNRN